MSADARSPALLRSLALVAVVVVVVLAVLRSTDTPREDRPTGSFCITYGHLHRDLAAIERVTSGHPRSDDLSLNTHWGAASFVWSDAVARKGPKGTEDDALMIAGAVRTSLAEADPSPLQAHRVQMARQRLAPAASRACGRRLEAGEN